EEIQMPRHLTERTKDEISAVGLISEKARPESPSPSDHRNLILIVDDNRDIRAYLRGILQDQFRLEEARNGQEALEKAIQLKPDLILSDVMMPKMDGYELCRNIKTREDLRHTPMILLTAKASEDMKVEGLETGADDYIAKPFNARELSARVGNLIKMRD